MNYQQAKEKIEVLIGGLIILATYNALVSYYIENTQRTWD